MSNKSNISQEINEKALKICPGGVHNPARSFQSVGGGSPIYMRKGLGCYLWDEDGNQYIDYVMGWGAHILGHSHPLIVQKLSQLLEDGVHFGTPTRPEFELSETLVNIFPSIDMIRFVNSGTEAIMAAVRAARVFTGKKGIVKFLGCYHGWNEEMLAGSTYSEDSQFSIYLAPYNNLPYTQELIKVNHDGIAAVILEPVAENMGVILPQPEFLQGLRKLCTQYNLLLIFDEVMTGFRVAYGGVQIRDNIEPDLTCLGKIIGGGFPIGAYGGRSEIMKCVAPLGKAYQGGTYSGNPISTSAGSTVIDALTQDKTYGESLEQKAKYLCNKITELALRNEISTSAHVAGGMFTIYFCENSLHDFETVKHCNTRNFTKYFLGMLKEGIYWPPSQFEAAHLSLKHEQIDLDSTISAASKVFASWQK